MNFPDDFKGKRYKTGMEAYQKYGQRDSHNNQVDMFGNYKSTIVGEDEPNWDSKLLNSVLNLDSAPS